MQEKLFIVGVVYTIMILNRTCNLLWHVSFRINFSGSNPFEYDTYIPSIQDIYFVLFHFSGLLTLTLIQLFIMMPHFIFLPSRRKPHKYFAWVKKSCRRNRELEASLSSSFVINRENSKALKQNQQKEKNINIQFPHDVWYDWLWTTKIAFIRRWCYLCFITHRFFDVSEYDMEKWIMLMLFFHSRISSRFSLYSWHAFVN